MSNEDLSFIKRRLSKYRVFFTCVMIRDFCFLTPIGQAFTYSFLRNTITSNINAKPDIVLKTSAHVLRKAFRHNYIEDIGLSQLCEVHLQNRVFYRLHVFSMFFFFHILSRIKSYGYFKCWSNFFKMLVYFAVPSYQFSKKNGRAL